MIALMIGAAYAILASLAALVALALCWAAAQRLANASQDEQNEDEK